MFIWCLLFSPITTFSRQICSKNVLFPMCFPTLSLGLRPLFSHGNIPAFSFVFFPLDRAKSVFVSDFWDSFIWSPLRHNLCTYFALTSASCTPGSGQECSSASPPENAGKTRIRYPGLHGQAYKELIRLRP